MALRRTTWIFLGLGLAVACGSASKSDGTPPLTTQSDDDGGSSGGQSSDDGGGSGSSSGSSGGSDGGPAASPHVDSGAGSADAKSEAATAPTGGAEAGTILDGDGGTCATLSGLTTNQSQALQIVNQTRAAMGSPCATMVAALNTSATDHCNYYAANINNATCIADPHVEVSTCTDYVAAQFYDRETAAGYTGSPSAEDMAFDDSGTASLDEWINSVWHRTPILDPWTRDYGYGSATMCDTMDFGVGASAPSDLIVTYPYDGQTGVPTSFNGAEEGPTPPEPPAGWPSGYPVHVFIQGMNQGTTITTHEFSVVGGAQLAHQWITPSTPNAVLYDAVVLYGNAPLTANTTYLVHVAGTGVGGAPVDVNITFTTQ
jgi:uncharacterized protein YkwD